MVLTCRMVIGDEPDLVERAFIAEQKKFKQGRASYKVIREKEKVIIEAEASDPTALRAVVTSITRILNIVLKTKNI